MNIGGNWHAMMQTYVYSLQLSTLLSAAMSAALPVGVNRATVGAELLRNRDTVIAQAMTPLNSVVGLWRYISASDAQPHGFAQFIAFGYHSVWHAREK